MGPGVPAGAPGFGHPGSANPRIASRPWPGRGAGVIRLGVENAVAGHCLLNGPGFGRLRSKTGRRPIATYHHVLQGFALRIAVAGRPGGSGCRPALSPNYRFVRVFLKFRAAQSVVLSGLSADDSGNLFRRWRNSPPSGDHR